MLRHSVILSSYNRPKFVVEAIKSVFAQTSPNWQLIIADDASNEETLRTIQGVIGYDKRCILLKSIPTAEGPRPDYAQRIVDRINEAIFHVSGDIVHYLPDDDYFHPSRFSLFDEVFGDESVVVAYGMAYGIDLEGKIAGGAYLPEVGNSPLGRLDHGQVAHRSSVFRTFPKWEATTNPHFPTCVDGWWFLKLITRWNFVGFPRLIHYKRIHDRRLQKVLDEEGLAGMVVRE